MADALEGPGHHLDPSIMIAVAWGSFSPPQLDTSAAMEAYRALAADGSTPGRKQRIHPRRPHTRVHPVHEDRNGGDEGRTRSTMDPVLGPWTVNLRPP